jgi:hypothetical protein
MKRLPLIILVLLCAGVAVAAAVGGLWVRSEGDKINVVIDKKVLQEKAENAIETTKEAGSAVLEKAGQALHGGGTGAPSGPNGEQAPASPAPHGPQRQRHPDNSAAAPDKVNQQ